MWLASTLSLPAKPGAHKTGRDPRGSRLASPAGADRVKTVVRTDRRHVRVFGMRSIDGIAEDYVEQAVDLDPAPATFAGIAGHDGELPDLERRRVAAGRAELDLLDARDPGRRRGTRIARAGGAGRDDGAAGRGRRAL